MKFGEVADSIYAYSFFVQEGYSAPAWPFEDSQKILVAVDGSIIDVINFGARARRIAEFNLNYMNRAAATALKTWMDANEGQRVRVEIENAGERVFGEQYTAGVYYAYLMKPRHLGEAGFSPGHELNGFAMQMEFAGTSATSVPNAADTSRYDFLIVNDCARITPGCQVANLSALNAITNKPGGSRGLTIDNLKVYFWNSGSSTWEYQYTLPANDPSKGLKYGVFRWSAFADVSGSSAGIGGEDFKAGWIAERSIKFPRYSVAARQGPAVEHPEGFSYAVDNSGRLAAYPLENNLAFYGAFNQLYVYDRTHGVLVPIRAGFNNKNEFDYTTLRFEIEPAVFLQNATFPTTGPDNYPDADQKMRGKPVLATYGRHQKGELQTQAFGMTPIRFPAGKKYLGVTSWNSGTKVMVLDLPPDQVTGVLGYAYGSYPASTSRLLYAAIYAQEDQSDVKKLRRVLAVGASSGKVSLTLSEGFSDAVDSTALVVVYLSNIQIVVDENPVIGMRASGYLTDATRDGVAPLELYGKEADIIKEISGAAFAVVPGGDENEITVNTDHISLEEDGRLIDTETAKLGIVNPSWLHGIVDKTHVDGYSYFDFGFSPEGVPSNEVKTKPIARITVWADTFVPVAGLRTRTGAPAGTNLAGQGMLVAGFSNAFTTLAWTPFDGATGYRLRRHLLMYLSRDGSTVDQGPDPLFGTGDGVELKDGSIIYGSDGVVTISGGTAGVNDGAAFMAIDHSVDSSETRRYQYAIEPICNGQVQPSIRSMPSYNRAVSSGVSGLRVVGKNQAVVLVWPVPDSQGSFTISQNGTPIAGMPVSVAAQGWFEVTGLTNNQEYLFTVSVNSLAIGTGGDKWFVPAGNASDHGIHQLLSAGDPYVHLPYSTMRDSVNVDLNDTTPERYAKSWGVVVKKIAQDGIALPAAAVVFSWLWKVSKDPQGLGNLAGAKDVRILANFSVRSWTGDNTPVPFIIQLRAIKADKSSILVEQYEDMTAKAPPEVGSRGAYARFENLRGNQSGSGSDAHYDTAAVAPNADGLYTGKDMWKLPDILFEDDAIEWGQVEYLMFSVTNAEPIPYNAIKRDGSKGYRLGIGGPVGADWTQVKHHKPDLYIEYVRIFDGGLREPIYGRIDGGRVDDAAGTITGTPGKIIEKAKHVVNHVVSSMLGVTPTYIGTEMYKRDSWIWKWQRKESMTTMETLKLLAKNINGCFTLSPEGGLYLRPLDIDDPNQVPVFHFTEANILENSLGKTQHRQRSEIYQKFLAKYNIDPSQGGPTEEMMMGWDLANGRPLYGGYQDVVEDANGNLVDVGSLDNLAKFYCRLSTQLYAAGVGINEYGTAPGDSSVFDMFYRPTEPSSLTKQPKERALPNLATLWPGAKPPKAAMRERFAMLIQHLCFDSHYFPLSCSMKNVIYNPAVTGKKDEAGTADPRLKLVDLVTVNSMAKTNGQTVKCLILDIELDGLYDGYATLHVFAPRPPGVFGPGIDNVWDAGGPGPRKNANLVFKGNLYGLNSEDGTFADAGGPGPRVNANMTFPDGTYADAKGTGNGKA